VTIHTATGAQTVKVDQTDKSKLQQWHSLGTFELHAGNNVPVVTFSTDGITQNDNQTVSVSVDAVKLVKK
jgi:hypothetical protein